ncbi:hypothetical protein FBU59_001979 [Linderina macrospora]|uniref:Uncharacterized protein n=1 Tax=Linderina macrospora TaxID=4868 RepID=A0ACC1JCI9_9FUNG|nr:hypothetical protein FBU59_001979 [Linderina macrospora]
MTSHLVFDDARYAALSSPGDREMFLFKWLSNLDAHLEAGATTVRHPQSPCPAVLPVNAS